MASSLAFAGEPGSEHAWMSLRRDASSCRSCLQLNQLALAIYGQKLRNTTSLDCIHHQPQRLYGLVAVGGMPTSTGQGTHEQNMPVHPGARGLLNQCIEAADFVCSLVDAKDRSQCPTLTSLEGGPLLRAGVMRKLGCGKHKQQTLRLGLGERSLDQIVEVLHARKVARTLLLILALSATRDLDLSQSAARLDGGFDIDE
jgi:hypothetical protein